MIGTEFKERYFRLLENWKMNPDFPGAEEQREHVRALIAGSDDERKKGIELLWTYPRLADTLCPDSVIFITTTWEFPLSAGRKIIDKSNDLSRAYYDLDSLKENDLNSNPVALVIFDVPTRLNILSKPYSLPGLIVERPRFLDLETGATTVDRIFYPAFRLRCWLEAKCPLVRETAETTLKQSPCLVQYIDCMPFCRHWEMLPYTHEIAYDGIFLERKIVSAAKFERKTNN